jgi:hypothetical protein
MGYRSALLGGQLARSGLTAFRTPRLEQFGVLLEGPTEGPPVGLGGLLSG